MISWMNRDSCTSLFLVITFCNFIVLKNYFQTAVFRRHWQGEVWQTHLRFRFRHLIEEPNSGEKQFYKQVTGTENIDSQICFFYFHMNLDSLKFRVNVYFGYYSWRVKRPNILREWIVRRGIGVCIRAKRLIRPELVSGFHVSAVGKVCRFQPSAIHQCVIF